jgi:hypothetical protein
MILMGCNGNMIDSYAGTTPVMKFDEFFNGPLTGYAIVQDRRGKVIKSFTVTMNGHWDNEQGSLQEHFLYSDGKQQDRMWKITKLQDGTFEGTANDIIGTAIGRSNGEAIQWNYIMSVDVDGSSYDFSFDDWMYLMNDHLILNRSTMTKFGIKVGEITISIQKK